MSGTDDFDMDDLRARRDEARAIVIDRATQLAARVVETAGRLTPRDVADAGLLDEALKMHHRLSRALVVSQAG